MFCFCVIHIHVFTYFTVGPEIKWVSVGGPTLFYFVFMISQLIQRKKGKDVR